MCDAEITIKNISFKDIEHKKGYELTVNAGESKFFYTPNTVECNNIECSLTHNQNDTVAHLNASKALINRSAKSIFLSGPVLGNLKELVITGNNIVYDFAQQTLSTNQALIYKHPEFNLQAPKSFVHLKNNSITMDGGVTSEFIMHDKQQ